jgi:hypothetical protein
MTDEITVEIDWKDWVRHPGKTAFQFFVRQKLRSAGVPIGEWGSPTPTRGEIEWRDDWDTGKRVITWRESDAK